MRPTIFAEQFLVLLLEVSGESSGGRYDASRRLNLREDGSPAVELNAPELATTTKVRREADDFQRDATLVATGTKAPREPDDLHRDELMLATTTRQAPGEQDDFSREEPWSATRTAIRAEADDFARDGSDAAVSAAGR